jgi:hypothetical protein
VVWGSRRADGFAEPLDSTYPGEVLGTLDVPAGSWLLTATVNLADDDTTTSPFDAYASCTLDAGADSNWADASWDPSTTSDHRNSLALQVAHTFTTADKVYVRCGDALYDPSAWRSVTITAVEVTSVTKEALN